MPVNVLYYHEVDKSLANRRKWDGSRARRKVIVRLLEDQPSPQYDTTA